MSRRPRRPKPPTTASLQSTQLHTRVQISPFDFRVSRQRQQSQAYNGLHSRQSLPSRGNIRHLRSQGRAFTPFRHVRTTSRTDSPTPSCQVLVLLLFHIVRYEYRDSLQHHRLSKGEPLCCQGHYTFHLRSWAQSPDYGSSSSSFSVQNGVVFVFVDPFHSVCCALLAHEFFEVFVQMHRLGVVTLHHLSHFVDDKVRSRKSSGRTEISTSREMTTITHRSKGSRPNPKSGIKMPSMVPDMRPFIPFMR